jgi:tRNA threonylcarbamoyladenosine biosynthesis protein TsaE
LEILCSGPGELKNVVALVFEAGKRNNIWLLKGEIGAGKTTFMHELANYLGVEDVVTSPSYALINEYQTRDGEPLYHFDYFRIRSTEEAVDTGFFEYIDSGHYCFIEWPEKIESLIPARHTELIIRVTGAGERIFKVNLHD